MPRVLLKILKWVGIVFGGLGGLIVVVMAVIYFAVGPRLVKEFDVQVASLAVPTDAASIKRGSHIVSSIGLCTECHGEDLAGEVMGNDPFFGRLVSKNLTSGRGGVGGSYSDEDFVRAIRHGISQDGKPLVFMPSESFNKFSDGDLGAIIAYIRSLPPVDNELPGLSVGPMGRLLILLDDALLPAHVIDHAGQRSPAPEPGVTAEYGEYLTVVCTVCHGDGLTGGSGGSAGPNITPSGSVGKWTEAEFMNTLRTGKTPTGAALDNDQMPWKSFARLTDDELHAIRLYLVSLPSVDTR